MVKNIVVLVMLVLVAIISGTEAFVLKNRTKSLKERAYEYCSCRDGVKRWEYTEGVDQFVLVCNNGDYVLGHYNVKKVKFRDCSYIQE